MSPYLCWWFCHYKGGLVAPMLERLLGLGRFYGTRTGKPLRYAWQWIDAQPFQDGFMQYRVVPGTLERKELDSYCGEAVRTLHARGLVNPLLSERPFEGTQKLNYCSSEPAPGLSCAAFAVPSPKPSSQPLQPTRQQRACGDPVTR
jgi:hypothetical protein